MLFKTLIFPLNLTKILKTRNKVFITVERKYNIKREKVQLTQNKNDVIIQL